MPWRTRGVPLPRRFVAAVLVVGPLLAGCPAPEVAGHDPRPAWRAGDLPVPPGGGRAMLRDVLRCGEQWYVVGAVAAADRATRPAIWRSADAVTWETTPVRPSTFYGERGVMFAAGCRAGRLAAVAAKSGGVHGNPRVTAWRQVADGSMVEVPAEFELFGGPEAVNVARIAGGSRGWLIIGNRSSGAAAWTSPDATRFRLVAGAPGLAGDGRAATSASDVTATADGWLAVGAIRLAGRVDDDPAVWTSPDGRRWRRELPPATAEPEAAQQVVLDAGGVAVVLGRSGTAVTALRRTDAGDWAAAGRFAAAPEGRLPEVGGVAVAGSSLVALISDGRDQALWTSLDGGRSWRPMAAPAPLPAGGDRSAAIMGDGRDLMIIVDDGLAGRAWTTRL